MIDKLLQSRRLKVGIAAVMAVSLLILCFSMAYPASKRAEHIDRVGGNGLSATASLSTAMTYFAGDTMTQLRQNPSETADYRSLCGLLTRVKDTYDFERTYLLYRGVGGKYYYLLDAGYRDNATVGVDYQAPGSECVGPVMKATRSLADKVYSQKLPAAFGRDILTTADHRKVIVSLVPVQDNMGGILGLLVVESAAGNTDFAKLGPVNFQLVAAVSGGVLALTVLLAMALYSLKKAKQAKQEAALDAKAVKVEAEVVSLEPVSPPREGTAPPWDGEHADAPSDVDSPDSQNHRPEDES